MKRLCFALDLKNDPELIEQYKNHHREVWPEVLASITDAGILQMDIYLIGCRLFMVMEVEDSFRLEDKAARDRVNPRVQAWEELMWRYQAPLPQARPGEKWVLAEHIFHLPSAPAKPASSKQEQQPQASAQLTSA